MSDKDYGEYEITKFTSEANLGKPSRQTYVLIGQTEDRAMTIVKLFATRRLAVKELANTLNLLFYPNREFPIVPLIAQSEVWLLAEGADVRVVRATHSHRFWIEATTTCADADACMECGADNSALAPVLPLGKIVQQEESQT